MPLVQLHDIGASLAHTLLHRRFLIFVFGGRLYTPLSSRLRAFVFPNRQIAAHVTAGLCGAVVAGEGVVGRGGRGRGPGDKGLEGVRRRWGTDVALWQRVDSAIE